MDFARRRWGTAGDADLMVFQPRVSKLVSMVDGEACLPVYQFLINQLERADFSLSLQECKPLYPDARTREELEYLPECRSVSLTEEDLLVTSSASQKLAMSQMTRGLMTEIYRYVDKYYNGQERDRFHDIIQSLFQTPRMIDTEKHTLRMRVKRDLDRMKKMKKAKQIKQFEMFKKEQFDMPEGRVSSDPLVDRLNSLNLGVGQVSIPAELRGIVESLANSFSFLQAEGQKLLDRNQQLEVEKSQSQQRQAETVIQHKKETEELRTRLDEKSRQLKAARRLKDHYKEQTDKGRLQNGKL